MQKQIRLHEVQQQSYLAKLFPSFRDRDGPSARDAELAELHRMRRQLQNRLAMYKQTIRNFDSDPAVRKVSLQLDEVIADIKSLSSAPAPEAADPHETIVGTMQEEIRHEEEALKSQLGQVQASMPEHQQVPDPPRRSQAEDGADREPARSDHELRVRLADPEEPGHRSWRAPSSRRSPSARAAPDTWRWPSS